MPFTYQLTQMSGVIVTDWYSFDDGQSRIKINIRVVDQEMNDESLVVNLFTQSLNEEDGLTKELIKNKV